MNLLQMSFSGAVFIIAIVIIRAMTINKLPKKTFLVLWKMALLRLLIPFSIPSIFSVYTLIGNHISTPVLSGTGTGNVIPAIPQGNQFITVRGTEQFPTNTLSSASVCFAVWLIGMILFAIFFALSYLRCLKKFQTSLPVCNDYAKQWLKKYPLKRPVSIRQSDRISAPLTYGIFRPVILLPQKTNWENDKQLQYVLSHEYVHIYRFDTITKLIATVALCIHWFNPAVWILYILFNRDIELACDEAVVHQFGEASKSAYAHMLIDMSAKQSGLFPFCNNFSKNAIEERIRSIMKTKKATAGLVVGSLALVLVIITLFATSAQKKQMVFVSGRLFVTTNRDVSEMVTREAEISEYDPSYIGIIESAVSRAKEPDMELQSNFGNIGSEIVFNGNGIAVNLNGKWIQFEPKDLTYSQQDCLAQLEKSISYLNGNVQFTIPDNNDIRYIQINGRIIVDGNSGMSVHYLTDESENNNWESGKTYSFDVSGGGYTELYLDADNERSNISVNIMELLPGNLKTAYDSTENEEAIAAFVKNVSTDSIVVDIVEYIDDTDTEGIKALKLTEADMPDGYYLFNPDEEVTTWKCNAETVYTFIDWNGDFTGAEFPEEYTTMDIEEFQKYIKTYDNGEPKMPFFFTVENGYIKQIIEKPFA